MPVNIDHGPDIAKAIQLSLAPEFLLMGVATMLNVMTGRLARIVDRMRALTEGRGNAALSDPHPSELRTLGRRRHIVSVAITAGTVAGLLLCTVIIVLFVDVMFAAPLHWPIGILFVASTLALVVGWAYFLREVHLATRQRRVGVFKDPIRAGQR